ncbi:MAG TPA: TonB-dependent receptor [Steroidobacteraceae bacterium]
MAAALILSGTASRPSRALDAGTGPAAPAPAAANDTALEEITVTARRKAESLQSVPVSITALSGEDLREQSITTTEDLQMSTPGVYLSGSGGNENVVYQIRGQSKALSGPSSPAVVSYFADVPDPTFGSSVPQYDMASIQVLKGPQGTLYGRNTLGGAVLYTPNAPTYDFGGYVTAIVGNYSDHETEAALNLPLVDQMAALRLGGDLHQRDGYTKNLGVGGSLDDIDSKSMRVSLLLEPISGLRNLTILDYYKNDYDGDGVNLISVAPGNTLLTELGLQGPMLQQLALQRARGPYVVDTDPADFTHNRRTSVVNRTDLDLGAAQVVNIFGYRNTHLSYYINVDGAPVIMADGTGAYPAGTPLQFIRGSLDNNLEQFTDEIQVKGKAFADKLDWLGGLFYFHDDPTGAQGNFVGFAHIVGTPTAGTGYNFLTDTSKAVFLHGTYDLGALMQGLSFEAGARYTRDDISSCTGTGLTNIGSGVVPPADCAAGAPDITNSSINSTSSGATTWLVGFNWQLDKDLFTYLVSRRGYQAGGINSPTLIGRLAPFQSFAPETVTDVELGLKSDWHFGEAAVRVDADVFSGWYNNVQSALTGVQTSPLCTPTNNGPGVSPTGSCNPANDPAGGTLLVNVGKTQVSGIDLQGEFAPVRALTFSYGANFLDPRTVSTDVPASLAPYATGGAVAFNMTAKRTFTGGARYAAPVPDSFGQLVFNVDEYYTSAVMFSQTELPPYAVMNLRLDWNGVEGHNFDLSAFVRNAANREYVATPVASGAFLGMTSGIYGPPRMFGVEFRARIGK